MSTDVHTTPKKDVNLSMDNSRKHAIGRRIPKANTDAQMIWLT